MKRPLPVCFVVTVGILLGFQFGCDQRRGAEVLDDKDKEIKELMARIKVTTPDGHGYDSYALQTLAGYGQRSLPYLRTLIEGEDDVRKRTELLFCAGGVEDVETLRLFIDYLMGDQNTSVQDTRNVIGWLKHLTGKDFEFDSLLLQDRKYAALNDELCRLKDRDLVSETNENDSEKIKELEAQLAKIIVEASYQIALKYRSWLERELEEGRYPIRSKEEREAERKAIKPGPPLNEEAFALFRKGTAYFRLGELDNALSSFKKCLEIDPDRKHLYLTATGNIYRKKGEWEEAIAWYERALTANPEDAETCSKLGDVYMKKGEWEKVIHYFQMACDRAPRDPRYRYFLGWALAKKGDYAQAMEECKKLRGMDPPEAADYVKSLQRAIRVLRGH